MVVNLFGDRRTQQGKAAAEPSEIARSLGIEVGEAAVDQVAAQLPFQIAEAPALRCFLTQQRSRRSGAIPVRPVRFESGLRVARYWRTKSTRAVG
jgi:hypothetical protein